MEFKGAITKVLPKRSAQVQEQATVERLPTSSSIRESTDRSSDAVLLESFNTEAIKVSKSGWKRMRTENRHQNGVINRRPLYVRRSP